MLTKCSNQRKGQREKKPKYILVSLLLTVSTLIMSLFSGCAFVPFIVFSELRESGLFDNFKTYIDQPEYEIVTEKESESDSRTERETDSETVTETHYFSKSERQDIQFDEADYIHCNSKIVDINIKRVNDIIENGGTSDELIELEKVLYNELNTMMLNKSIIEISYYKNPSDEYTSKEMLYTDELLVASSNSYNDVFSKLATSEYGELVREAFGDEWYDYFYSYVPMGEDEQKLLKRESELVDEYYKLSESDTPQYERIGEIFVELVGIRNDIANYYGYENYAYYSYENNFARLYTPEQAESVWKYTKEYIAPIVSDYGNGVYDELFSIIDSGRIESNPDIILDKFGSVLPKISLELDEAFQYMLEYGLYDIKYNSDKADVSFTTVLAERNQPYLFMSPSGSVVDYMTLFHEFGHFTNFFYTNTDCITSGSDYDLSELQSQGFEVMMLKYYDELFGEDTEGCSDYVVYSLAEAIVGGAMYDEFQQIVYSEENLNTERVNEIFVDVSESYGYMNYDGWESYWMKVPHNFEYGFYYISYATSAIGALELYDISMKSWSNAIDKYLMVCAMDTQVLYYDEALREAGLDDIFEETTYIKIASAMNIKFQ